MAATPRTRAWFAHIGIVVAAEFAAESARGLVLPTLFAYAERLGGNLSFVALLTALFSAGRFVSTLAFGWLSDRVSFKNLYVASAAFAIVGNLLYVLPYSPHIHCKALLCMSRFLVGIGAGNRSVCRANVAALTRMDQRTSYFAMLATVVFLAYALTPGLGGVFGDVDVRVAGSELVRFNSLTAPGFVLVGLNFVTIVLVTAFYDSSVTRSDAPTPSKTMSTSYDSHTNTTNPTSPLSKLMTRRGILVFILLNVSVRGMLSIFETINVPLYLKATEDLMSSRGINQVFVPSVTWIARSEFTSGRKLLLAASPDAISGASQFYLTIGLFGLISYAAVLQWGGRDSRISDVGLLGFAFFMLLLGNGVLVALAKLFVSGSRDTTEQFQLLVIAEILIWSIGSPVASAVIVPAFSKVLGTKPQGSLMGLFGASASIARIAMPLIASALSSWELVFFVNISICVVSIVALVAYLTTKRRHGRITYKKEVWQAECV